MLPTNGIAAGAETCVRRQGKPAQLPAARDANPSAKASPPVAVGGVFEGRAPDLRAGATAQPGDGAAIIVEDTGGWPGVVQPPNVFHLSCIRRKPEWLHHNEPGIPHF